MDANPVIDQELDFLFEEADVWLESMEMALGVPPFFTPQDGESSPGRDSMASDSSFDGASSPSQHQELSELSENGNMDIVAYINSLGDDLELPGGNNIEMDAIPTIKSEPEPGSADILKQASQAADIPGEVADVNMELSLSNDSDSGMSGTNDPFLTQSDPLLSQSVKPEPVSPMHVAGVGENKESWFTVDADHSRPVHEIWQSCPENSSDYDEPAVHVNVKGKRGPVVEPQTETDGYFLSIPDGCEPRAPIVEQPPSRSPSSDSTHQSIGGNVKGSKSSKRPQRKRKSEPTEVEVTPISTIDQLQMELDMETDKQKKNAIIAKLNREKKKLHIQELEDQKRVLAEENDSLKMRLEKIEKSHGLLEEEVVYLKSVIANQSTLSKLLSDIKPSSLHMTTSFSLDHDYEGSAIKRQRSAVVAPTGGICLHVHNENVSMEFCAKCAQMANGARRRDLDGV